MISCSVFFIYHPALTPFLEYNHWHIPTMLPPRILLPLLLIACLATLCHSGLTNTRSSKPNGEAEQQLGVEPKQTLECDSVRILTVSDIATNAVYVTKARVDNALMLKINMRDGTTVSCHAAKLAHGLKQALDIEQEKFFFVNQEIAIPWLEIDQGPSSFECVGKRYQFLRGATKKKRCGQPCQCIPCATTYVQYHPLLVALYPDGRKLEIPFEIEDNCESHLNNMLAAIGARAKQMQIKPTFFECTHLSIYRVSELEALAISSSSKMEMELNVPDEEPLECWKVDVSDGLQLSLSRLFNDIEESAESVRMQDKFLFLDDRIAISWLLLDKHAELTCRYELYNEAPRPYLFLNFPDGKEIRINSFYPECLSKVRIWRDTIKKQQEERHWELLSETDWNA